MRTRRSHQTCVQAASHKDPWHEAVVVLRTPTSCGRTLGWLRPVPQVSRPARQGALPANPSGESLREQMTAWQEARLVRAPSAFQERHANDSNPRNGSRIWDPRPAGSAAALRADDARAARVLTGRPEAVSQRLESLPASRGECPSRLRESEFGVTLPSMECWIGVAFEADDGGKRFERAPVLGGDARWDIKLAHGPSEVRG